MSKGHCNRCSWVGPPRHKVEDAQNDAVWHRGTDGGHRHIPSPGVF